MTRYLEKDPAGCLVWFDIDGTQLYGAKLHGLSLMHGVNSIHNVRARVDWAKVQGITDNEILVGAAERAGIKHSVAKESLREMQDAALSYFLYHAQGMRLQKLRGVRELHEALRGYGARVGVITGNLKRIALSKLNAVGLDWYVDEGISAFGEDGEDRNRIAGHATSLVPEQGLVRLLVGDTPHDIDAAKNNGILPIGVATGIYDRKALEDKEPYAVLDDLSDTRRILDLLDQAYYTQTL